MDQPLVSVIMGVYNQMDDDMLKDAVNSILNQTYTNLEFLIWDDGSCQDAALRVKKLEHLDERIHVMCCDTNNGLAYSLNECILRAKGKYIARMDADDYSVNTRIEKQVAFLESHPEYAWCGTNAELFDENGIWGRRPYPAEPTLKDYYKFSPFVHPSVVFRAEIFDEDRGYLATEETLRCEDYEIFMHLMQRGLKGYNIQEYLFRYRETRESYRKRKVKYRINEAKTRYSLYKDMGILFPLGWMFVLRPIVACLVPASLLALIKRSEGIINKEYDEKTTESLQINIESKPVSFPGLSAMSESFRKSS